MNTQTQIASHLLRARLGTLCVALTGTTADELCEKATAALRDTNLLEFRLDYLAKPAAAIPALKTWIQSHGDAAVIATCRCKANGGRFAGSSTAALEVLLKAADAGFALVDIELESAEKLPRNTLEKLRAAGAAVILSWHDFHGTPKDLDPIFKRMLPFAPDFMKVVPTAKSLSDNLTLMRFLGSAGERSNSGLVGICMGEAGVISRVLGIRAGSAFTFAASSAGEETASGQIAARTLIETYRIEQVDAATKIYGVAGNPIGASMSPVMMNTALRRETVNAVYLALQTSKADDLFRLMREIPIQGLSVTMPLKTDVIPHLERIDPLSQKIGAVNTIARMADGKFYGFNTDVAGIVGPLERRLSLRGARILVLGAGGAARAAVFGCRNKGADVWILNRTPEPAQKLARQSGAKVLKRDQLAKQPFDILIHCTPAGMLGNKTPSVLTREEFNSLSVRLVFDTVYNPIDTPLLRMARQKGLPIITGVEMFVTQGARQFEIWTGKPAPEEEMLRVVIHALRQGLETGGDGIDPTAPASRVTTASAAAAAAAKAEEAQSATAPPAPTTSPTSPQPHPVKASATPGKASGAPAKTTRPVDKPPAKTSAPKPAAKPAAKPPTKSAAKSASKPVSKPAAKPKPTAKAPLKPTKHSAKTDRKIAPASKSHAATKTPAATKRNTGAKKPTIAAKKAPAKKAPAKKAPAKKTPAKQSHPAKSATRNTAKKAVKKAARR